MAQQQGITVRRARARDAGAIMEFVNRILAGRSSIDRQTVLERFGQVGLLLAERDGKLIGILGWRAENLVVRISDLLIWPASERVAAAQALFAEMEDAASGLQCEAALLLPPRKPTPPQAQFFIQMGYESRVVEGMPKAWREASLEAGWNDTDTVLMKQLRTDRVLRPL
jgi:N-acetylglutamate synthase-like GNAT family acetyltransferase